MDPSNIAIIGGGPAGLTLALCLARAKIACTVFEARSIDNTDGWSFFLFANSLRILDDLGIYDRVRRAGYSSEYIPRRNAHNIIETKSWQNTEKDHGYKTLRLDRHWLIQYLTEDARKAGVELRYDSKFSHIVGEEGDFATFALANGEQHRARLVIGADGLHSRLRRYYLPNVVPDFTGDVLVLTPAKRSQLRLPQEDFQFPSTFIGKHGLFFVFAVSHDGEDLIAFTRAPQSDWTGGDLEVLQKDKSRLRELMAKNKDTWSDVVQSVIDNFDEEGSFIWATQKLPQLERWISPKKKIIVIGDAAHAMPPVTAQGINQSIEDGFTLSMVLEKCLGNTGTSQGKDIEDAILRWQKYRQTRIDAVIERGAQNNKDRLPEEEKKKVQPKQEATEEANRFLYLADYRRDVEETLGF